MSVTIAQVTDCHLMAEPEALFCQINPAERLQKVLADIKNLPNTPDFIVFTGDIVQQETAESYQLFANIVANAKLPQKKFLLPGNHDLPAEIAALKRSELFVDSDHFSASGWQFLLLDSYLEEGRGAGSVDCTVLNKRLEQADHSAHLALFVHHHIAEFKSFIDNYPLNNALELRQAIAKIENFKGLFHGHVHAYQQGLTDGIAWFACPASSVQFDHQGDKNYLPDFGYQVIKCQADGRIQTSVRWL
ncbi:metallophosphoesterase family protein [Gayadomonas joobiniege]|uniref:metallophosphoesterase family protein n=1 Tax=Gayadomonas joobiniege TaxID=1234606 RepID=UPI0003741E74|nr:metallophosphoesterase [Gayadomonas joobiniege]